jgi:hypothetical protein
MTRVSQFLGNRLSEALNNHQRPFLVNGCIDTYSRSNKKNRCAITKQTQLLDQVFAIHLEKKYLKSRTVDKSQIPD